MKQSTRQLESYLHENIPLTRHLGICVEHCNDSSVCLSAPIKPNLNHRSTAFGGSLTTLAITAGWLLLHTRIMTTDLKCHLVIQKSNMDFMKPVADNFKAQCSFSDEQIWQRFVSTLKKYGRARITVQSEIMTEAGVAGSHQGMFVAVILDKTN